MNVEKNRFDKSSGKGRTWAGLILLLAGVIFLIRSIGGYIPNWLTSWPMVLILIGIFIGSRSHFKNVGSFILIFMGVFFLAGDIIPGLDLSDVVFPVLLMCCGLYFILSKKKRVSRIQEDPYTWDKKVVTPEEDTITEAVIVSETSGDGKDTFHEKYQNNAQNNDQGRNYSSSGQYAGDPYADHADFIDTVSVFGSVKKNIFSKNFKGGDIVTIMGGAEINLSQADIKGSVIVDVTQVFGGTKLIVPPQWKVSSDLAALFGGIEDKRPLVPAGSIDENKILIIKGTSIFGGIDIRSY